MRGRQVLKSIGRRKNDTLLQFMKVTSRILAGNLTASEGATNFVSTAADCVRACDPNLAEALSEILSDIK